MKGVIVILWKKNVNVYVVQGSIQLLFFLPEVPKASRSYDEHLVQASMGFIGVNWNLAMTK